jgi:DNA-directed RNA polymerase subunit M/transcription elongation factor TFIIS
MATIGIYDAFRQAVAQAALPLDSTAVLQRLQPDQIYNLIFIIREADLPTDTLTTYVTNVANGIADLLTDNPLMTEQKQVREREFTVHTTEADVQDNDEFPCPRCKGRKVKLVPLQERSGDEQQAMALVCYSCGYKWYLQR